MHLTAVVFGCCNIVVAPLSTILRFLLIYCLYYLGCHGWFLFYFTLLQYIYFYIYFCAFILYLYHLYVVVPYLAPFYFCLLIFLFLLSLFCYCCTFCAAPLSCTFAHIFQKVWAHLSHAQHDQLHLTQAGSTCSSMDVLMFCSCASCKYGITAWHALYTLAHQCMYTSQQVQLCTTVVHVLLHLCCTCRLCILRRRECTARLICATCILLQQYTFTAPSTSFLARVVSCIERTQLAHNEFLRLRICCLPLALVAAILI